MGHDWIFDVLADLRAYAEQNGLPKIAAKTEELLCIARDEIGGDLADDGGDIPTGRMN